ncbi:MAG: hypothetical protein JXA20_06935 [Spirochaetes bacterium]|nr:hypothetical protein [Spirochaetota bacterium]
MNRRLAVVVACTAMCAASRVLLAQGLSTVSGFEESIRGLIRASNVMLFDNTPLETHFRRGAWVINATPAYTRITRAVDSEGFFSSTTVRADAVSCGGGSAASAPTTPPTSPFSSSPRSH